MAAALAVGGAAVVMSGCSCEGPRPRELLREDGIPLVRVKLGDDSPSVAVAVDGPYVLRADGKELESGKRLAWTTFRWNAGGIFVGPRVLPVANLELVPASEGTFQIRQQAGASARQRSYRGRLGVLRNASGTLRPVNVINIEAYVAGVLPNELLSTWHVETYKALAVAARTYALVERSTRRDQDFDVFDSAMSQVYGGADSETSRSWEAVSATRALVGAYEGPGGLTLFKMYYHSTCGGATVPSGAVFGGQTPPPLTGVACPYCGDSKYHEWHDVALTKHEITQAMRASGNPALKNLREVARVEVAEAGPSGRAAYIRVVDGAGHSLKIDANEWRLWVGSRKIPSTWFTIRDAGDRIILDGRGWGHGVGMCQWGAEYLAAHGQSGEQILRYYYPSIVLVRGY